jgi:hypothetical protein
MAQETDSPNSDGANFVRQIVSDPKNVPDVMLLYGYAGASSEEGHERLYLTRDLSAYVEVPRSAILHQAQAAKEQDPHGGVTLWVKKDAQLQYKMAPGRQALAHYFAGAIAAGAAACGGANSIVPPQVAGAMAAAGIHQPTLVTPCLNTHAHTCGVHVSCGDLCGPTNFTPCLNTHANTCNCPLTHNCPTQVGAACQGTILCSPGCSQGCSVLCVSQGCTLFQCGV